MENFSKLKRTKSHKYLPNFSSNFNFTLPSWKDLIHNLNYCVLNDKTIKLLPNFGLVTWGGNQLDQSSKIIDLIIQYNSFFPKKEFSSHIYASLTEISETFGKHSDVDCDLWIVQCEGITEWTIYENESKFLYPLNPSDILYIPRGMYHDTKPLSPRMSLSIGYHGKL